MAFKYIKHDWETYDKTLPTRVQEKSIITKERLDHMEEGIQKNSKPLAIGDLTVGDSPIPSASVEDDDDLEEVRLNIVFPKQSQIEDNTIKDDATWSSRKIRNEIDNIAANVKYTCEITSNEGLIFNTTNDVKTLRAKIFMTGEDITVTCDENSMIWSRKSTDTDYDDFWNGKAYSGRNIVVSANELNGVTSVTYYCSYSGINSDGATISAVGSVTVCNMIYEPTNTSISFTIDASNGTIFDNKSDSSVVLIAQAYEGSNDLSNQASFKWFMNSVWIPEETNSSLVYPVVGLPLVTVFTCQMTYSGMTYKNSVTIQNRKNVTVSDTAPNDPQLGDIWYDVSVEMYKKWTSDGWIVIEDPTQEVTGDILLSVSAIKSVQETDYELKTLREATYTMKDELETKINSYSSEITSRADGLEASFIETKKTVDEYDERITSAETSINNITANAETFQVEITKRIEDVENSSATDENIKEIKEASAKAVIDAEKIYWLISKDSEESKLELTSSFMSLLTGHVVIDASKIDLRGYTTINDDGTGGFTVDESGYMIANNGGRIGPWIISNESISLTTEDGDDIYFGKGGLNFSDNLILSPMGGIESPNFKIDPITNSVYINAETMKVGGINAATTQSKIGVRNLILTSGSYQPSKPTKWETGEIPWSIEILPERTEENADEYSYIETYITFTKLDKIVDDDGVEIESYIKLPLSEEMSTGNYVFNIRTFTIGSTHPTLKIYFLTESGESKKIGELSSLTSSPNNITFIYDHATTKKYKYIGFKCSDFDIGDSFSIINMSLYKSEVTVREWQPAPEDVSNQYTYLSDCVDCAVNDIILEINNVNATISSTVQSVINSDDLNIKIQSIITQTTEGLSIETVQSIVEDSKKSIDESIKFQDDRITEIRDYIDLKNGIITLGKRELNADGTENNTNGYMKLSMSNEKISFSKNNYELAYFSSSMLHVNEIDAKETLQIGNFKFFQRSNGNLSIAMVGRDS